MSLQEKTQDDIRAHAVAEFPRECCGVVIIVSGEERYVPCRNLAETPQENFILSPEDYALAEDDGEVLAVVHSHPNVLATPSQADLVQIEASGLRWYIVHVSKRDRTDDIVATDINAFDPNGYEAPLVGRRFTHGVLDCYALVKDYYSRNIGIELPEPERRDNWWLRGENLYLDNYEAAGFEQAKGKLKIGDVIFMQIRSPTPNHAAVYIGDGLILHHLSGRLSSRDVYDGYWQEVTRIVVRRKEVNQ